MTKKPTTKSIEDRIADLERDVAALKAAVRSLPDTGVSPGFAEEGPSPLVPQASKVASPTETLEQRVTRLEAQVAELKGQSYKQAMLDQLGLFKDSPVYDEAMRLGREWRRR